MGFAGEVQTITLVVRSASARAEAPTAVSRARVLFSAHQVEVRVFLEIDNEESLQREDRESDDEWPACLGVQAASRCRLWCRHPGLCRATRRSLEHCGRVQ